MTNSKQDLRKATPKQHRLLRELADERGVSFTYPQSSEQASAEIKRLKGLRRMSRSDRHRETRAVREAMARRGGAASVTAAELTGYGSSAGWR
jgi:hypothetical protein